MGMNSSLAVPWQYTTTDVPPPSGTEALISSARLRSVNLRADSKVTRFGRARSGALGDR